MGGYGSGRQYGRPLVEHSLRIDLAWMLRKGLARDGCEQWGNLNWSCNGEPSGSIGYKALMHQPGEERLVLEYTRGQGDNAERVVQSVYLTFTRPKFGGKRWWMICPYSGERVGKLYLPPGGDRFASRKAWNLDYHSQRMSRKDAVFERLFRLQKKLGCERGWGNYPMRPKGMHHRTYERLLGDFEYLDDLCAVEMMSLISRLSGVKL